MVTSQDFVHRLNSWNYLKGLQHSLAMKGLNVRFIPLVVFYFDANQLFSTGIAVYTR